MPGTVLFAVSLLGELEVDRARHGYLPRISLHVLRTVCLARMYRIRDLEFPKTVLRVRFSHNGSGPLNDQNRSVRPKMRTKCRIPLGNNTGLNDLLVWSTPKLDRTPNTGRAARTPASPGYSPCGKSWFRTSMLSLQRTLLNPYLAQDPVDVAGVSTPSAQPTFYPEILTVGLTLPRDPGYGVYFRRCS